MTQAQSSKRMHPLVAVAAVSVILVCLVGVAAMTGILPNSNGSPAPRDSDTNVANTEVPQKNAHGLHVLPDSTVHSTAKQKENDDFGVVESVRTIEHQAEKGSGLGAAAGAILGGVLGHQVGGGKGRDLATVAGAVGGGLAGNEIEKRNHTSTTYEVRVRMESGNIRTFTPPTQPDWRAGDRVKIVGGNLAFR